MFDRFTDRARKVLMLAKQEALDSGSQYIGTEHLLVGLLREPNGVGHHVLESLDLSVDKIRKEIEKTSYGKAEQDEIEYSPKLKLICGQALEEAKNLDHNYVGTEHLLLALLLDETTIACKILTTFGVNVKETRTAVFEMLGCFDERYEFEPVYSNTDEIFNVIRLNNLMFREHVAIFSIQTNKISFSKELTLNEITRIIRACRM